MNTEVENEFSIEDISGISHGNQVRVDTQNYEQEQEVLSLLKNSKNSNLNGEVDERIADKIKYLNSLNQNNQEMKKKIK